MTGRKKNDVFDFQVKPLYDAPLAVKSTSTTTSPALPAPVTPQVERIDVPISDFATTTDGRSVLSTRGLSNCTAIAVLTDFRDGIYHKRTLMHFQGGVPSDEMYTTLKQLDADLANGGKVIFLGGDLTKSPVGIGVALGQSHNEQKVLLDIVKKQPESTTIGTASGIDINPDGSYKLIEGNNNVPTVFDQNQRAQVFDMADD
ncbi:hypothetical protein [Pseudomonas sp. PAMC 26793]|uniref:hypothetical protein n=1 Tax=Pseudomonas sp. PAMC 26793 TaxID=1240676 RepID=UPI0015A708AB|nr:hypothetical protein [Pseudomonas sp. PAMC 26793]